MWFLIFVVVFLVVIVSWAYLLCDCWRLNVVGPVPLPIVGNSLLFLGDTTKLISTLEDLHKNYGDAVRAYLLLSRYMLFGHPKHIEPLCASTEFITKGRSYNYLKPWLGDGLLTSSGPRWKKHRKLLTPAFHFNILQSFLPVFNKNEKIILKKLESLANGQPFDVFPMIALLALDNVTESIMGVSINAQGDKDSKYVKAIEDITELVSTRMRNPFIWNNFCFNLFYKRRQDKALAVLFEQTNKVIASRRDDLEKTDIRNLTCDSDLGIKNKHAFLDLLLLSEAEGGKVDDVAIREEVDTFMFEGHDTTTSGIVFCLYCISKHEDVQNKVLQEQLSVFEDDLSRDVTFSDLHKMQYLELVIKESLRLYPSVPFIERYITHDSKVGDIIVPKDTSIIVNILKMQRHPEVHQDPLKFLPERAERSGHRPFDWMFFSAGPRNCIGQKFAMMEMKVTLSAIIRKFKLVPSSQEPILCADLILRSKNGVNVGFVPRYNKHHHSF